MKNGITTLCLGVLMVFFLLPAQASAASLIKPDSTLYYYFRMDTMGLDLGYLRVDSSESSRLTIDRAMGDRSLWRIIYPLGTPVNCYYIINKYSGDTLAFDVPFTPTDTLAKITSGGPLDRWDELFDLLGVRDSLKSYNNGKMYFLSYDAGQIWLSPDPTAKRALTFTAERYKYLPDESLYYQLAIDTLGKPDVLATGFLYADTSKRMRDMDSLIVSDLSDDLSFWKFVTDTIISDTTYFRIYNKETDSLLAFDVPAVDTLAIPVSTGVLNQWRIPFFAEDKGIGRFVTCDTLTGTDYYLAMTPDSVIMLVADTTVVKPLSFVGFIPPPVVEPLDSAVVDSTQIYRVRYIAGPNPENQGRFLGADEKGGQMWLDTVYPHIPNGQFVINRDNRFSLSNRLSLRVKTDSLFVVCDIAGDTIPDQFHNRVDTFEVLPLDYGSLNNSQIEALKEKVYLGYKYMLPADLAAHSYAFSFNSPAPADTLNGLIMGYGPDSVMMLLPSGDTALFIMDYSPVITLGAPAIGKIASIERPAYTLRSIVDSSLYVSSLSSPMRVDVRANRTIFFLKEDTVANNGTYYFIDYSGGNTQNKVLADAEKQFNLAKLDSTDTHLFTLIPKDRKAPDEPDDYTYLTDLKDIPDSKGRGFYEFRIPDPLTQEGKWLTMNYYYNAVLGKEGESMLRAGSYTPNDLQLWVDTARGTGFNPDKPSFYIVKDVDTTATGFNGFNVSGYFLHVMDSTSLASFDDYVVYNTDSSEWYNRANFVNAMRQSANELKLGTGTVIGESNQAANEYRFYLQEADAAGKYHVVTEAGYGDGGKTNARGYLSVVYVEERAVVYFGPRENAANVSFSSSTVANEVIVTPPAIEEVSKGIAIIGGAGRIDIRNAAGQEALVFNVLGQPVVRKVLSSDSESLPVSRGIVIVKVGTKTQKVVVK